MDRRVAELQQRLWKKKAALQQKENQLVSVGGFIKRSSFFKYEHVPPRRAQWKGLLGIAPPPGWQQWGRTFSPFPRPVLRGLPYWTIQRLW